MGLKLNRVPRRIEESNGIEPPNPTTRGAFRFPSESETRDAQEYSGDEPLVMDEALRQGIRLWSVGYFRETERAGMV